MSSAKIPLRSATDLRKLHHALVLAAEGSYIKACAQLCLTQSALTRSIQTLESDLELRLFDRSHVRVIPTPAGKMVLERAQALLNQARNLARDVELIRGAQLGSIELGVNPITGGTLLPSTLERIYAQHPHLKITVESNSSIELLSKLLDEKLEFFVGNPDQFSDRTDISIQPLARIPVHFFVRRDHPLTTHAEITIKAIAGYPLISPRMAMQKLSVLPKIYGDDAEGVGRFVCDEIFLQKAVALSTDAVLLTAKQLIEQELAQGQLQCLALEPGKWARDALRAPVCIVKLAGRSLSPTADLLIRIMRDVVREQGLGR